MTDSKVRNEIKPRGIKNGIFVLPFVICFFVLTGTLFTAFKAKDASAKTKVASTKTVEAKSDEKTGHNTETAKSGREEGKSAESGLMQILEKKKADLDSREIELNEREARLNQMSKEIDTKIAQYGKMREEIESSFKKMDAAQGEKVSGLVKIYEAMSPKEAALRIQELDRDIGLLLLSKMKPKVAAKVLALIEPAKAADMSQGMVNPGNVPKRR